MKQGFLSAFFDPYWLGVILGVSATVAITVWVLLIAPYLIFRVCRYIARMRDW